MGSSICALFGSQLDFTGRSTLLQERSSVRMWSPARHLVVPFLYCPMAPEQPIHFGAGIQLAKDLDSAGPHTPVLLRGCPEARADLGRACQGEGACGNRGLRVLSVCQLMKGTSQPTFFNFLKLPEGLVLHWG